MYAIGADEDYTAGDGRSVVLAADVQKIRRALPEWFHCRGIDGEQVRVRRVGTDERLRTQQVRVHYPNDCITRSIAGYDGRSGILKSEGVLDRVYPQISRRPGRGHNAQSRQTWRDANRRIDIRLGRARDE